jgi:Flp pilus assembly protein TadG
MPASFSKLKHWLLQQDTPEPRRAPRFPEPDVVVHYWGGPPAGGQGIRDISERGAYVYTRERWYPGTIIRIVFQSQRMAVKDDGARTADASICIDSRVVRQGDDGVAVEFVYASKEEHRKFQAFLASVSMQGPVADGVATRDSRRRGQALVEFSLIIPLVLLLAVNAVNFGGFIFAWITVADAARDGAEYMVMSSASPGKPTPATSGQISSLITSDVTSLLNRSSLVVATCTNATTSANGCTTLTDPEAPAYALATVDVTYTYNPFIPLFSFPVLNISATLPTTTIHRKAVMRMLQ